jgi:hypothetical protein
VAAVFSSLPDPQPAIVKASIPINAIVESRCIAGSPKALPELHFTNPTFSIVIKGEFWYIFSLNFKRNGSGE